MRYPCYRHDIQIGLATIGFKDTRDFYITNPPVPIFLDNASGNQKNSLLYTNNSTRGDILFDGETNCYRPGESFRCIAVCQQSTPTGNHGFKCFPIEASVIRNNFMF